MRPVIGHYRSHLDITSAGQEHQAKRSLMRRRRAEDAEHAKKRKLSVSLRSRGDSSRTIAGLERPQECDELFSFGWVQLQAEFVPLNSMGFGTRWAKPPGHMSIFQAIGIEHLFEASCRAVM